MFAAAALVLVTIIYRVILGTTDGVHMDWWHNFSPMAAITLCGAIYFPRRIALIFPLLALLISDCVINAHYDVPMLTWDILPRYVALGFIAGFGWLLRDNPQPRLVFASSLAGSVIFFIVTNTASWLAEPKYAGTVGGWTQAMTTGLPGYPSTLLFFRNSVVSDLFFTGLFLGCILLQRSKVPHLVSPRKTQELAQW